MLTQRPVFSRHRVSIKRAVIYNAAAMLLPPATVGLLVLLLSTVALPGQARADNVEEARAYVNKATAAYALNHYAAAAENFEKAFEPKPDPALLYNAAQAYRLAGNKERALELYESYVRVYTGKKEMRPDIEGHIKQLREAIEHDKAVATSPPITTVPVGGTPSDRREPPATSPPPVSPVTPIGSPAASSGPGPVPPPPASASTETGSSPVVLTQTAEQTGQSDSVTRKTWFWVAVGGGVAAAVIVGLVIGLSGTDPAAASIGKVNGN
jgi:hypothetical protein